MSAGNWDAYWRNAQSAAAHKDGGPQDEVLERFWTQLFEKVFPTIKTGSGLLDIACGNGAVARFALTSSQSLNEDINLHICGLDESPAALEEMCKRHPMLSGIAASALLLPFKDESFELITSQFGMEYAGADVFTETTRVLRQGGILAAVLHMHGGGIYKECEINMQAIDGFRNSNLLNNFEELFKVVMAKEKQSENKESVRRIERKFADSVAAAEEVLKRWGKGVASGTLLRIYTDVGHMYRRLDAYDADELFNWIDVMKKELGSYAGRMSSMLGAALDEAEFENAMVKLCDMGFEVRIRDTLIFGRQTLPSAWIFVAEKARV
ncbi:MAG: class I SAM-dependent methyltransferase [Gammaproteobacteria bacterium]|nr:class I SAM-dependent methyltransferase [Gammaproteobacteria bacterium]